MRVQIIFPTAGLAKRRQGNWVDVFPGSPTLSDEQNRHCKRSEAIQISRDGTGLLRRQVYAASVNLAALAMIVVQGVMTDRKTVHPIALETALLWLVASTSDAWYLRLKASYDPWRTFSVGSKHQVLTIRSPSIVGRDIGRAIMLHRSDIDRDRQNSPRPA